MKPASCLASSGDIFVLPESIALKLSKPALEAVRQLRPKILARQQSSKFHLGLSLSGTPIIVLFSFKSPGASLFLCANRPSTDGRTFTSFEIQLQVSNLSMQGCLALPTKIRRRLLLERSWGRKVSFSLAKSWSRSSVAVLPEGRARQPKNSSQCRLKKFWRESLIK